MGTNMFRTRFSTGDNIASVYTIMSGSTRIESLSLNVNDITSPNYWTLDDRTVYGQYNNDGYSTGYTLCLINATGGTQDTKSIQFIEAYGSQESNSQYRTFYFGCNSVTLDGYGGWYVNDTTTGFTQTEYYYWQQTADQFFKPNFLDNSDMVLYHYGNNLARVLTATGISDQFSLSAWADNRGLEVGDTMFMHYYNDDANGYYHFRHNIH
jgi:hypothetical protein